MKKVLAVFLSVILLSLTVVPAFAVNEECNCGEPPIIYVAALGSGTLTLDEGTKNERVLFRPDTGYIIGELMPVVSAAGQLINDGDYDAFGDVLIECVDKIFGDLALDKDGKGSNDAPDVLPVGL